MRSASLPYTASEPLHEAASAAGRSVWRGLQWALLGAGMVLVALLLWRPALGLNLLWNGLIPLAPALVVVAPGLWRNVCPLATWSLLPRRLGISAARIPSRAAAAWLRAGGVAALLLIVPVRHLCFNSDGPLSALLLLAAATAAFGLGLKYERRGGWCAGACPIHPVEKLYGISPAVRFDNARCERCDRCSAPCADSTRSMNPTITAPGRLERLLGHLMVGGFAGFICGWFQIPDYVGEVTSREVLLAFAWPVGGGALSLALYLAMHLWFAVTRTARHLLVRFFAAAAVSSYYAFRIPTLVGFGLHPGSGMLVDLTGQLPAWAPWVSASLTTAFFFWFLLIRPQSGLSWNAHPVARP